MLVSSLEPVNCHKIKYTSTRIASLEFDTHQNKQQTHSAGIRMMHRSSFCKLRDYSAWSMTHKYMCTTTSAVFAFTETFNCTSKCMLSPPPLYRSSSPPLPPPSPNYSNFLLPNTTNTNIHPHPHHERSNEHLIASSALRPYHRTSTNGCWNLPQNRNTANHQASNCQKKQDMQEPVF
jgi:hypothetical protein